MAHYLFIVPIAVSVAIFASSAARAQYSAVLAQAPAAPQSQAGSQESNEGKPGIVFTNVVAAQASVTEVDKANRKVTLRTDDGREQTMKAGPEIRNFDQIEKGDKVNVEYQEATAIFVRKPEPAAGAPSGAAQRPTAVRHGTTEVAPLGQKPSGVVTEVIETTATIEDIDYAKRQVTLKGPDGKTRTVGVSDRVENLQSVMKGDEIVVRRTEAVAIAVTK